MRSLRRLLARTDLPGGLQIAEHARSGRNRLFLVSGEAKRWMAKASRFTAESWFYREVGPHLEWVPACTQTASPHVVVTDYLDGLPSVFDVSRDKPNEAIEMLASLAPPLAQLHGWSSGPEHPGARPPQPELYPVHVSAWLDSTEASQYVLRALHRRGLLCRVIRDASAGLGPQGLIHGDLKADNVLWSSGGPVVLDWELCGTGCVGWDLGSVLGSILAIWIDGVKLDASGPDAWFDDAVVPYAQVCDAARQFLADYRRHAQQSVPSRGAVVAYTASWLVGRAWAESLFRRQVDPRHLVRLVVAEGLVRNPHALLGGLA